MQIMCCIYGVFMEKVYLCNWAKSSVIMKETCSRVLCYYVPVVEKDYYI
jgi:hypothetical protein